VLTYPRAEARVLILAMAATTTAACGGAGGKSAASTPACMPAGLRATAGFQGATGSMLGGLSVTNTSGHTCALPTTPQVSLIWHGRTLAVQRVAFPHGWLHSQYPRGSSRLHLLKPGQTAFVVLQWWNWCGPKLSSRGYFQGGVALRLGSQPGGVVMARLRDVAPPYCNGPPSTMRVSGFLPPLKASS